MSGKKPPGSLPPAGHPKKGEQRQTLEMYNFKAPPDVVQALKEIEAMEADGDLTGRRSTIIRRAILHARDCPKFK
jgi:hypothetical protein